MLTIKNQNLFQMLEIRSDKGKLQFLKFIAAKRLYSTLYSLI